MLIDLGCPIDDANKYKFDYAKRDELMRDLLWYSAESNDENQLIRVMARNDGLPPDDQAASGSISPRNPLGDDTCLPDVANHSSLSNRVTQDHPDTQLEANSGYDRPWKSSSPRNVRTVNGLRLFDELVPSPEFWRGFKDVERWLKPTLTENLRKHRKPFHITFRLMFFGHDAQSARPFAVIICPERSLIRVRNF